MGPTPKYRGRELDVDGARLTARAHPDGYPTREEHARNAFLEKERKAAASEVFYYRSQFFTLPTENAKYEQVMDWIANGQAILRHQERHRNEDRTWDVWVEYLDVRGYVPTDEEMSNNIPAKSGRPGFDLNTILGGFGR